MNDYIDRQAAIEAAYQGLQRPSNCDEWKRILEHINAIPSAEVEPVKRGKWIGHNISEDPKFIESIDKDTCSECGQTFFQIAETGCLWNYCPNCGAKNDL